jgi:hypothetical protein
MDRFFFSTILSGLLAFAATGITSSDPTPKRTLGDVTIEDTVFDAPKEIRGLKVSMNALERDMTELENKFTALSKSVTVAAAKPVESTPNESITKANTTETVVVAPKASGGSTGTPKQTVYQTGNGSTGGSTSTAYVYSQPVVSVSSSTYFNENGCVVDANGNVISCPRQPVQSYSSSYYTRPSLRLFRR